MEEPRGKRPRRPKFTVVEMLAMVRSVAGKHDILFGKFTFDSASTVVRMKAASWQCVIDAVNATNPDGLQAPLHPTHQIVFPPLQLAAMTRQAAAFPPTKPAPLPSTEQATAHKKWTC